MNAVVLPSRFTRDVLLKTSQIAPLRTRVEVVPESFPDSVLDGGTIPDLQLKTSFNFLIVSQLTATDSTHDRKNILNTIKWICEEFKDEPDVGIIVKTNSGRSTTIDRTLTRNALRAEIDKIKTHATVYMLHGDVSEQEMMGLYRHPTVKALVSLTRGEGFGLPLLEAAASGLPVIATGWSAHTEFLGLGKYVSIGYDLVPLHDSRCDGRIFVKGSRWANPSESDFKKRIRKFKNSPDVPRQWAAELMQTVRKSYGWPAVKEEYDRVLLPIIG
jgi:glycosyltransferase involved in cell wall biosynthesis